MTPADLQRIAFVTRRYAALQGLRPASTGAGLLLVVALLQVTASQLTSDPRLQIFLIVNLVSLASARLIDGYYKDTFGAVRTGQPGQPARILAGPHVDLVSSVVLGGLLIDSAGMARWLSIPSCAAMLYAGHSLWILVRDGRHRPHYVVGLAAAIFASWVAGQAPQSVDHPRLSPEAIHLYLTSGGLIGLGMFVTGLLDHHLLAVSLARRAPAHRGRVISGTYWGKARAVLSAAALTLCIALAVVPPVRVAPLAFLLLPLLLALVVLGAVGLEATRAVRGFNELMRARKARLLARIAGHAPDGDAPDDEPLASTVVRPDVLGHVVLPLTIGVGLLVDGAWRNHAFPSIAAVALSASHLRITIRGWPLRKHYLVGVCSGVASVLYQMTAEPGEPTAWVLRSVMLISAAMIVEGLLDYRLELRAASYAEGEAHAESI